MSSRGPNASKGRASLSTEERVAEVERLSQSGKIVDAASRAGRLIKEGVRDARLFAVAAYGALDRRKWAEAEPHLRAWVAMALDDPGAVINLAWCLNELGREAEAEPLARRAVEIAPDQEAAWSNLLVSLRGQKKWKSGLTALAAAPGPLRASQNMLLLAGDLHCGAGDAARSLACALEAQRTNLEHWWPSQAAAFTSNYVEMEPARRGALHRNFGRLLEESVAGRQPFATDAPPTGGPDKRLRVAFISHDLRDHPVGTFCRPLFEHWDRGAMELLVYSTHAGDAVSAHLRTLCDRWTVVGAESPQGAANNIRRHGADVLIELHGLTEGNSLATVALRPAPLQATWCGFPNTTGLRAVDLRIVDALTDPPENEGTEPWYTEQRVRLDGCFLCYAPPWGIELPAVREREPGAPVTFGSFNISLKITPGVLALWKRVLDAVPGSRLLVKSTSFAQPEAVQLFRERASAADIDPARLNVLGRTPTMQDHLAAYHAVDVALDTFPYHGTTTTCEAMLMGVPVVSRIGDTHGSRVALSLLTAASRPADGSPAPDGWSPAEW
ncbi:MAG: hypothetical protein K2Q09_09775, partial [Phycisphaerales bacterium]|nr:hypothetical protein [Phycisphaerales bacterium]